MERINSEVNAINWFEIPVVDTKRAKKFYETILNIEMQTQYAEETKDELTFFPFKPGVIRAISGKVSGALVKNERAKTSGDGTTVYLKASSPIREVINRIEPAGGKIIVPKTKIIAGYISIFLDPEGNKVGLHATA